MPKFLSPNRGQKQAYVTTDMDGRPVVRQSTRDKDGRPMWFDMSPDEAESLIRFLRSALDDIALGHVLTDHPDYPPARF